MGKLRNRTLFCRNMEQVDVLGWGVEGLVLMQRSLGLLCVHCSGFHTYLSRVGATCVWLLLALKCEGWIWRKRIDLWEPARNFKEFQEKCSHNGKEEVPPSNCGHIVLKVYVKEYISVLLFLNLHNFAFLRQRQTFDLGIIRLIVVKVKRIMKG